MENFYHEIRKYVIAFCLAIIISPSASAVNLIVAGITGSYTAANGTYSPAGVKPNGKTYWVKGSYYIYYDSYNTWVIDNDQVEDQVIFYSRETYLTTPSLVIIWDAQIGNPTDAVSVTEEGAIPFAEINVIGSGKSIIAGDNTPDFSDHTKFGSVDVSSGTATRTYTITNTGTASLTISSVTINGANREDFTVTTFPASTVAPSSGSTTFIITFNPSGVGNRNAIVTIDSNDSDEGTYDFAIQGYGYTPANLYFSGITLPEEINGVYIHQGIKSEFEYWKHSTLPYYIYKDASGWVIDADLTYGGYYLTGADHPYDPSPVNVITWNNLVGFTGTPNISLNAAPEIGIWGNSNVIAIADEDLTPAYNDHTNFGSVNVTSGTVTRTFTIRNTGTKILSISGTSISGTNASDFSITTAPPSTVASFGTATFTITFNPSAEGVRNATLNILSDDSDEGTYNFSIQGDGFYPQSLQVSGISNPPEAIGIYTFQGVANNLQWWKNGSYYIMNDGTEWFIGSSIINNKIFYALNNLQALTPVSVTSWFALNGGSGTPSIVLLAPEINIQGNSTSIADGDANPSAADHTDFGSTSVCSGTVVRTFTIQNLGTGDLSISSVSITGSHASDFSVTTSPSSSVSSSGTTTFQITFDPSASGVRTAIVTVNNNDSDEGTYDFMIQGSASDPSLTKAVQTNVACFGGFSGAASVNAATGGTGPYTYNWTPGNPTGDGTTSVTGLSAGNWTCVVTDAKGCTASQTFTVTQPSALSGFTVVTNVACFGGSIGAINLTASGGTPNYTYNWGGGITTEDRTGLAAGIYNVTITDANSCTGIVSATVTQPSAAVSGTTVVTNVACFGGSNGAINLTPTGGTSPYTYNWGGGIITEDRTGLAAGTYTVTITDANGCTGTVSATITQPFTSVSGSAVATSVACFGGSNGAISLVPSGGIPGYTFNWGGGIATAVRTGLAAGTYTATITDSKGCSVTVSATVTQPSAAVSGTTVVTNVSCFGGSNGAINLTPSGGTSPYTYNWGGGITSEDRTGLAAGTYTVTITDANGCTGTVSATVTQPSALSVSSLSQLNVSCNGGSNGAASANVSGGTGPYSYNWTPGDPIGDGTASVTDLTAGFLTCIVTDANGCTASRIFTIMQPSPLGLTAASQTNVSCNGGSNGAASVNAATGGAGEYTYDWTPGNPTGDATTSVTGLSAGTWTCVVTDANGCAASKPFTVTQPSALGLTTASQTNVSCNGGSNGAASVNAATGGAGAYSYNWTPGNPAGDGTTSINGLSAGTWTCVVTDANSCTVSKVFTVTQPTALGISIASQTNVGVSGGSNGTAAVNVTGGTPAYAYSWSPSGKTTASVSGLTAGTHTCTATDDNGCTASQTVSILEPATISTTAASSVLVTSAILGGNITNNGGASVSERGVVYSATDVTPTIGESGVIKDMNGTGTGSYSKSIGLLTAGTTYYFQAYAINAAGTSYGGVQSFTTQNSVSSVVRSGSNPTNTGSVSWTITFSVPLTGLSLSNFNLINTGLTAPSLTSVTGSGATWTVTANTGTGSGTLGLNIVNSTGLSSQLSNTIFTGEVYTIDKAVPTVTITSATSASTNASPIPVTINFSEPVTGFDVTDIIVTNGTKGTLSVSGPSYSIDIFPTNQGEVTVNIDANAASDQVGNANTPATQFSRTYDSQAPNVNITSSAPDPTNVSPIPINIEFSEAVTGFTLSDIYAGNGPVSNLQTTDNIHWTAIITPGSGANTVRIDADLVQDLAGNGNNASSTLQRTYDTNAPTVTLSSTSPNPTKDKPIVIQIKFNETVRNFDLSDIKVTNGTASNLQPLNYYFEEGTVDVYPTADGVVTVDIPAGAANDYAQNDNIAATQFSITSDITSPTVVISSTSTASTNNNPIPVTITFSEPVTGFDEGDILVTNGTIVSMGGSGATYTIDITPSAQGAVTVDIAAGVALDAVGNSNTSATQFSRIYDSLAPSVSVTSSAPDPINRSTIPLDIVFSEEVTGFTISDISVYKGTISNLQTTDNIHWTAEVTFTGMGGRSVEIFAGVVQDLAGNGNTYVYFQRTVDPTPPTVTLSSESTNPTKDSPIVLQMKFSETVVNFDVSDIKVVNGTASNLQTEYFQKDWTVDIYPAGSGEVTVDLPAGAVQDQAYNDNIAATQFSRTYDITSPTVVISSTSNSSTNVSPIPVTITFSEPVTDFVPGDIIVSNGTASGLSGSGTTYTINVTPASQGLVTVNVGAGVAADAVGNTNTAATEFSRTFDIVAPTVTITSTSTNPTKASPIPVTITFSEAVTGFVPGDITVANGSISGFSGSGTTYTVDITPSSPGTVRVNVAADIAADAAGNTNTAATELSRTYTPPIVTFDSNGGSAISSQTINYNTTATEPASPVKTGYIFDKWCSDIGLMSPFSFSTPITGDITLFAKWNIISYTVTLNTTGGNTLADMTVVYNAPVPSPIKPVKTGYTFDGWYKEISCTNAWDFAADLVTANTTLYAKWIINSYSITYFGNGNTGGSVPVEGDHDYNTSVTVLDNTGNLGKTGYTFAGWNTEADGSGTAYVAGNTFTVGTANVKLYAQWNINSYTVSFNSNGSSAITSQHITYNTTATEPTAPIKAGYTFAGWYSDAGLTSAFSFTTAITGDIVLYANWVINGTASQTITFNPINTQTYGNADFDPGATVSSSLNVTYTSSNTAVATIVNNKVHIVGAGTCTIYADQSGNPTYAAATQVSQTLTVNPKALTITGVTAANKVYDGTTTATLTGGALNGVINSDEVTLIPGTGNFADKNAGNAKTVTTSGYALAGAAAGNYTIAAQPSGLTANITKADLSAVIAASPDASTYRGGTAITFTVTFSAAIPVSEGTPYLSLNGAGVAISNDLTTSDRTTWTYLWTVPNTGSGSINIATTLQDALGNYNQSVSGKTSIAIDNSSAIATATDNASKVLIYPTVNDGKFKINIQGPVNGKVLVKIFNLQGVTVNDLQFSKSLPSETFEVTMNNAPIGMYMVEISMNGKTDIGRIIVE